MGLYQEKFDDKLISLISHNFVTTTLKQELHLAYSGQIPNIAAIIYNGAITMKRDAPPVSFCSPMPACLHELVFHKPVTSDTAITSGSDVALFNRSLLFRKIDKQELVQLLTS